MADIEVRELFKSFGGEAVLQGVSLCFKEGKRTAVMGRSGCGKTTLLRILAGLEKAESGEVTGISVGDFGMVFQEARLFPEMTAEQNVACVRLHRNDGFAKDALTKLGFDESDIKKRPCELSGGMQRRVSVARAIAYCDRLWSEGKRPILLLDEALRELDEASAEKVKEYIIDFCDKSECTVVSVTHDQAEAEELCHSIVLLGQYE